MLNHFYFTLKYVGFLMENVFTLFELRNEVLELLNNTNSNLKNYFHESRWLIMLAYLVDIFTECLMI